MAAKKSPAVVKEVKPAMKTPAASKSASAAHKAAPPAKPAKAAPANGVVHAAKLASHAAKPAAKADAKKPAQPAAKAAAKPAKGAPAAAKVVEKAANGSSKPHAPAKAAPHAGKPAHVQAHAQAKPPHVQAKAAVHPEKAKAAAVAPHKPAAPVAHKPATPVAHAPAPAQAPRPVLAAKPKTTGAPAAIATAVRRPATGAPAALPRDVIDAASAAQSLEAKKKTLQRNGFRTNEYVVYPSHGVGKIVSIEEQTVAGHTLELFVVTFEQEKMTLRVPTAKLAAVGMRKLSEEQVVRRALETLKGRARIKRTMWSRRAQEYENKINSGDLVSISEVVRDLYRAETQPEQSYSERQLFEAALDRMSREIAAIEKLDDRGAVQKIVEILARSAKGRAAKAADAAAGVTDGPQEQVA